MPTYDYRCEKCGDFEYSQRMSDAPLATCPTCGSAVQRLVSAAAFHLKGSGWYKTDYASSSSTSSNSSSTSSTAKPQTESTTSTSTSSDSSCGSGACGSGACGTKTSTTK